MGVPIHKECLSLIPNKDCWNVMEFSIHFEWAAVSQQALGEIGIKLNKHTL
jgi:hypothetical protein